MDFLNVIDPLSGGPLFAILAVLALVDSTSFGTLAIPVWLLMAPGRVRVARMLLYLGTITLFYFVVGLAVLLGAGWIVENLGQLMESRLAMAFGMLLGVGLFLWSFRLDSPATKERARSGNGRLAAWRRRATGQEPGGLGSLVGLALGAGLVEVASMLPYLAAIGLIAAQGPGWPASTLWLAGYCLVMVLPALVLLAARCGAGRLVERPLARLDAWFARHGASTAAWVVGAVGVVLVLNTAPAVLSADAVSDTVPGGLPAGLSTGLFTAMVART
ncbi:GAP family protein [Citricoccus sp. K5]|uniref:GAP family protein n=1 Tax=Citricoccus sp. K5 TaxID=2653135 RepID=UPI0012F0AC51|nr:GAP family protein [Citricoccus sp. K5]VXB47414.1 Sap-like sulfolipid-1-addressing protein [Citricoccus sp. K5]